MAEGVGVWLCVGEEGGEVAEGDAGASERGGELHGLRNEKTITYSGVSKANHVRLSCDASSAFHYRRSLARQPPHAAR